MLTDARSPCPAKFGQSIAFRDDGHGKLLELIADGYVQKDGDTK